MTSQQPLRQRIDAAIRPTMLIGLQDAELYDEPGRERIGEWADWITNAVLAVVEAEIAARTTPSPGGCGCVTYVHPGHYPSCPARTQTS
ncbi:hypothetical protein ACWGB8_01655 [Kitasatospora sp. NPDC054939]